METYIIRIYSEKDGNPVGVLEEINSPSCQPFQGLDALCSLLAASRRANKDSLRGSREQKTTEGETTGTKDAPQRDQ